MKSPQEWKNILLENLPDPVVRLQVILDEEGQPADYKFLEVNAALEKNMGISRNGLAGKTVTEIFPQLDNSGFDWVGTLNQVYYSGEHIQFVYYFHLTGSYFDITAYSENGSFITTIFRDITEEKKKEKLAYESRQFTQSVLDSSSAHICVIDEDGFIEAVNRPWDKFAADNEGNLEKTGEGINYLEVCETVQGEEREDALKFASAIRSIIRGEKDYFEMEYPCHSPHEERWFIAAITPFEDNNSLPRKVVITHTNITPHKEIEKILAEHGEQYRLLVENLQEGIWYIDAGGYTKYVNQAMAEMLGYTISEMRGKHLFEFLNEEERKKTEVSLKRRKQGVKEIDERKFTHKEGFQIITRLSTSPLFDDKGNYMGSIAAVQDITEQKQMEINLQESEEKFRLLAESSPLAIMMYQNDYWVYVNPAAEQFFGYSAEEFYSMRFWDFVHPDYKEIAKSRGKNRQAGINDTTPYEFKVITKQGLEKWIFLSGSTVSYQGAPAGMINCMDITESKQAKYELQRAYAMLESEISKASSIHEKILPQKIPQPQNISIAAHFQPAEIMGGDFYNVIHRDGKLIFYLSDVSGHGLDGAMISAFIKEAIESYVKLKPDDIMPGRIIEHVSEQYYRETYPDEQLICIFVGVIDLESMELRYSSAGFQTYPLVRWGTGEREKLKTSGLFISNMVPYEFLNFEESSIYIDDGTTIMFSTDGLFEQKNGEEWFYQYIEDIFYRHSHLTPEIIVQDVNKEFCFFNNNSLVGEDDITFLVFQVGSHSNQQKNYSFKIPSDLEELKPLYEEVSDILSGYEEKENFLNCMHELVANAMEHGNQFEPNKEVAINITLAPQFIAAEVEDEGEGFNWCEKINKPLDIEDFTERGRGIPLLCLLSCNLFYNAKGNRATMVIE